jgi:thiamine biosynthesis lipoprotein
MNASPLAALRPFSGSRAALVAVLILAAGAGAALAARSHGEDPRRVWVERRLELMGTEVSLGVSGPDRASALAAAEAAVRELERSEARLSTWRPESELSRLNAAPVGVPVTLSPALAAELGAALACAQATGGAFDPAIGRLVDLWDLRGAGRIPTEAEIAAARPAIELAAIDLDGAAAVRRHPGLRLEEGAWGKGAAADAALDALGMAHGATAAWVDLGGQAAVLGRAAWSPTVADPADRNRPVVELELAGGSLATSGNGVHGRVVGGRRIGHLLDPKSGQPAPDFGSLTVWAERGLLADCLSTGLYVMGPDAALAWAARHPGVEVLALERDGDALRLRASAGLRGRVRALVPELSMSFGEDPGGEDATRK